MKSELTLIPTIQINPTTICVYNQVIWDPVKPSRSKLQLPFECYFNKTERIINSSRSAEGKVSIHAKRKITKALDYMLLMSEETTKYVKSLKKKIKFRVVFVTLTLPSKQMHTDNEIKRTILNSFIIELTRYHQVKNYIWRAEKQANGNIHFHLIIDKFVLFSELRKRWNRICNKLGYVDRYRDEQIKFHENGFKVRTELLSKWSKEKQYQAYLTGIKSNWSSPNSTDIHSIKFIKNLKNYVTKYLTKNEEKQPINENQEIHDITQSGRIWACNENLSDIKGFKSEIDNEIQEALKNTVNKSKCRIYQDDYFSVYSITIKDLRKYSPDILFKYFAEYMSIKFGFNSQLTF